MAMSIPRTAHSTGAWMREVSALAASGRFASARPIFVGGTGLYFRALEEGMSEMPDIPDDTRRHWRARLDEEGPEALHEVLKRMDARAAATLRPGDSQRIVRALEVIDFSGRSILDWQAGQGSPLIDRGSARFIVHRTRPRRTGRPDRPALRRHGRGRRAAGGAGAVGAAPRSRACPAAKAIGVRELQAALAGDMSMDEAINRAKIATRQYAKRQSTWFRNQAGPHWQRIAWPDEANAWISRLCAECSITTFAINPP